MLLFPGPDRRRRPCALLSSVWRNLVFTLLHRVFYTFLPCEQSNRERVGGRMVAAHTTRRNYSVRGRRCVRAEQ